MPFSEQEIREACERLTLNYVKDACDFIDKDSQSPGIDAKKYLHHVLAHVTRRIQQLPSELTPARDWTPPMGVRHAEELAAQAEDERLAREEADHE